MKSHSTFARILLVALLFLGITLDAQEGKTIAVLPPLAADKDVNDGMRNAVVAGFSEYISSQGSGYRLYDGLNTAQLVREMARLLLQSIEGKSAAQLMREMERSGSLYDAEGAKALGKKLGVQYVCISKLFKEAKFVLECKLINVETGATRGDSEYVSGGDSEMREAGIAVIKRLLVLDEETYASVEAEAMAIAAAAAARAAAELEAKAAASIGKPSVYHINRGGRLWHYWKDDQEVEPFRYDGFSVGQYCQREGDNYMGAKKGNRSVIVKNDTLLHYLTDGSHEANVGSVFVTDGNVYAGGSEKNQQGKSVATIWKDGAVLYRLTNGNGDAEVYAICISGNDVYAGGRDKNSKGMSVATVWKNGLVLHSLTNGTKNAAVNALFVTGNIVYSGGWETNGRGGLGLIWKNGSVLHRLNPAADTSAVVWSLFVQGADVYASGFQGSEGAKRDIGVATVWKNGKTLYRYNTSGFDDRSLVFVK